MKTIFQYVLYTHLGITLFFLTLGIRNPLTMLRKNYDFLKKILAVIYMKYFLLQFGPCLNWVYTYYHLVIERIATLHKNKKRIFIRNTT